MMQEFLAFLRAYGVIGLAIAVIIGGKLNEVVNSLVQNILMPFVGIFLPSGDWRTLGFEIAGAKFGVGAFLASVVDFLIVALFIYILSRKILRQDLPIKK